MPSWVGPCPHCGKTVELKYEIPSTSIHIPGKVETEKKKEQKKSKVGFGGFLAVGIVIVLFTLVILGNKGSDRNNKAEIVRDGPEPMVQIRVEQVQDRIKQEQEVRQSKEIYPRKVDEYTDPDTGQQVKVWDDGQGGQYRTYGAKIY